MSNVLQWFRGLFWIGKLQFPTREINVDVSNLFHCCALSDKVRLGFGSLRKEFSTDNRVCMRSSKCFCITLSSWKDIWFCILRILLKQTVTTWTRSRIIGMKEVEHRWSLNIIILFQSPMIVLYNPMCLRTPLIVICRGALNY